ncbi:hypothetical protein GCM10023195_41100 [Actinoallomurus liliacearum]|uniref:Lipoprotein n=1 Tax=Actinoallomurus liliacearum TaxID=1080073 RepID=A0ABP8TMU6_9ACTN
MKPEGATLSEEDVKVRRIRLATAAVVGFVPALLALSACGHSHHHVVHHHVVVHHVVRHHH